MVRVYIHGRPQGQDIWCISPAPNDEFYLNPFLDSKIGENMNAVLQVDMWHKNAYYSYIHRRNVVEKGDRPNAYFAITICFEKQYCTHVATLYELLDTIYKQLCLNNLIEKSDEQERFLVAQFQEKESVLVQITNVIQQNIEKYISNSLQTIEGTQDTISTQIKTYSTLDVDSPQFIADCATNRVLVSSSYSSKDKLPIELKKQIAVIETKKQKAETDRDTWQAKAEHQQSENEALTAKQKQLQEQIQNLQQQVATIKGSLAKEYQEQISKLQTSLKNLEQEQNRLNKELTQEKQQKRNLQEQNDSLQRKIKQLQQGKPDIIRPEPMPSDFDIFDIKEQLHKIKNDIRRMAGRFRFSNTAITMVATLLNSVLLIATIVLCCLGMQKIDNSDNSKDNNVATESTTTNQKPQYVQQVQELPIELLPDYSNVKIDIKELKGPKLKVGQKYTIVLKNANNPENYKWKVDGNDAVVDKDLLIVNSAGEITIKCIDTHNYIVKQRKISAE